MSYMNTEIMSVNHLGTKPKWIIWCTETDKGFTAMGSRKINQIDIEVDYTWNELDLFSILGNPIPIVSPPQVYKLTGNLAGFTMVVAKTELEAFVTLMHTFQQEEACEIAEAKVIAERIKDEKKREKVHKKAKKQAREGKFDAAKCPETCWYCIEEDEPYGVDYDEPYHVDPYHVDYYGDEGDEDIW